jgi:hypothetical protein
MVDRWWFGADFAVRMEDVARIVEAPFGGEDEAGVFVVLREEAPGTPKFIRTSMPLATALQSWQERLLEESVSEALRAKEKADEQADAEPA